MPDRHLSEIEKDIIKKQVQELEEKIKEMEGVINGLKADIDKNAKQIDKLDVDLRILKEERNTLNKSITAIEKRKKGDKELLRDSKLASSMEKYNDILADIKELNDKKAELEKERNRKRSHFFKKKYQRKIDKVQEQLNKLNGKKVKAEGKQRSMLMKKQQVKNKRINKEATFNQKRNYYADMVKENEKAKEDLVEEKGLGAKIQGVLYNVRGIHYQHKEEKFQKKLDNMSTKKCKLKSARVLTLPKKLVDKIRDKFAYGTGRKMSA